jgi:hypothetical protein
MIAHDAERSNAHDLMPLLTDLVRYIHDAARTGTRVDQVEQGIFQQLLALGRRALQSFFDLSGTGDLGEQVTLPDGSTAVRLGKTHARVYRSVFGDLTLDRVCYGTRDGQKIAFVPLDNRLQLPDGGYSYLLQTWDAALGVECAFARVQETLRAMLQIRQPVDSLEHNLRHLAGSVEAFRDVRPIPAAEDEGDLFVLSADGKGIVMRRGPDDPRPKAHRGKGDKANQKRMAIVGSIYSVDRYPRTPADVTAALFRDPRDPNAPVASRPAPVGKHVWARLSRAADGALDEPIGAVFTWLRQELNRRRSGRKTVVCVMDGQEALWAGRERHVPGRVVPILDLLHVTARLWQAGHLFHPERSAAATGFVRERVLRVLQGGVRGVVKGLRRMGTTHGLSRAKRKTLRTICGYLASNAERMRYDEYLRKGYPIASGVIEGACRHYVKDRMERSGMRWTKAGAQAMLDVRSEYLNGNWGQFHEFHIDRETRRLYPHRGVLKDIEWPIAA